MLKLPNNFVDMAHTPEEMKKDALTMSQPSSYEPVYPYGLSISLCNDELEKLNLSTEHAQVGDHILMECIAKVTSISMNDTAEGKRSRVELTLTHIAVESEDEEAEQPMSQSRKVDYGKFYQK